MTSQYNLDNKTKYKYKAYHISLCLNIIDLDPKYCIAVIIRSDDRQVVRHIRPCTDELPAICADTDMSSSDNSKLYVSFLIC